MIRAEDLEELRTLSELLKIKAEFFRVATDYQESAKDLAQYHTRMEVVIEQLKRRGG